MKPDKLIRVSREHAERMYAIALDKLNRDRERYARKWAKEEKKK